MPVRSSSNSRRHPYLLMSNWKGEGKIDLRFWKSEVENHQSYSEEIQLRLEEGINDIPIRHTGFIDVINPDEHRKPFIKGRVNKQYKIR